MVPGAESWLQLLTWAGKGEHVPVQGAFPLLRHWKLPLVPGYFQFPAPVLELSGPFSYKCRANQPSFLSTTHSFPNQTVRFERADKIFSFCCPTYNRIWKVLIFIPYLSHTHVAPLFLLPQPAP